MKGLLVDPIPSPSNSHHNNCEADREYNISPCQATARLRWTEAISGPIFIKYVITQRFFFFKRLH